MSEQLDVLFPGGKRVEIRLREFEIATDQSAKAGGEASAPEPFDLFLASMAACAGIYALNFCHSRSLPTEGLRLSMDWDRGAERSTRSRVLFRLGLPRDFPEKYRAGIVKAMNQCAVKKHIQDPPEFVTEILD